MITVHHFKNLRSQGGLWLPGKLSFACEVKRYAPDPESVLPTPDLRAVHPFGKLPVIVDDESDRTIAETGAIIT